MAVTSTVTRGFTFTDTTPLTPSNLNSLGTPTVDIAGAVGTLTLDDGSVTNAKVSSTAAIDYTKLASLTGGNILVGNSSNEATSVAMSGDATMSSAGALTVENDAITTAKIADSGVSTAKIADNAVDGTKIAMTSDAQGDLLYYDGTNYVRLVAGTDGYFLKTQGTGENPVWAEVTFDRQFLRQSYTTDGSYTFNVPSGVTSIVAKVWGGGGAHYGSGGGDGGAGGYCEKAFTVSGGSLSIVVGAGNTFTGAPRSGDGGDSTVTYDSTTITASGGGGTNDSDTGIGGTASGGDLNFDAVLGETFGSKNGSGPGAGGVDGSTSGQDGAVILEYVG